MPGRDDRDRILFAKTLRKHREKRGLSREELASEVHHSASTIANVETGYRAPTVEQARDFDEFFDTPGGAVPPATSTRVGPLSSWRNRPRLKRGSTLAGNLVIAAI